MRPIPHPDSTANRSSKIEELVEQALDDLRQDPGAGDIEYAIQNVATDFYHDASEEAISEVVSKIAAELPDEFQYERAYHSDYGLGLEIQQGCPHCGNEVIFNTSINYNYAQMVSYEEEDGNQRCFIDDAQLSFTRISCGCCHEVLVSDTDSEV